MVSCDWCEGEVGSTRFTAVLRGCDCTLCKTCFFLYINGDNAELLKRRYGFSAEKAVKTTA